MNIIEFTDIVGIYKNGIVLFHQRYDHHFQPLDDSQKLLFSGWFMALIKGMNTLQALGFRLDLKPHKLQFQVGDHTCCTVLSDELYILVAFTRFQSVFESISLQILQKVQEIKAKFDEQYRDTLEQWNQDLSRFENFLPTLDALVKKKP